MQNLSYAPSFEGGGTLRSDKYFNSFAECKKAYPNNTIGYNLKNTNYIVLDIDDIEQHQELYNQFKNYKYCYTKTIDNVNDKHTTGAHIILRTNEKYPTRHLSKLDVLGNREHTNVWIKHNKYPVDFNPESDVEDKWIHYFNDNLISFIERLNGVKLYDKKKIEATEIDIDSNVDDWENLIDCIDVDELNANIINNVIDLHHTEFWAIWTYCKYTNQSTGKFKSCWADSSGRNEQFSDTDASIGLFFNILKNAGINLHYSESSINKNWNCIQNNDMNYLDSNTLNVVMDNEYQYNLFVSPTGSGKTTSIVKYCVKNEKPLIIASPFIAVGVNYKENFINYFDSEIKKMSVQDKFLLKWHDKNINERFVFSENENGERVFKQYHTATKKFCNIKKLPSNYIMICTVQFLIEIKEQAQQYCNATLIVDEAHCIELGTKYCNENDKLFFEYFQKTVFVTATPNARTIRLLVNYLPNIQKYKVNGILPKVNINLVQPSEKLVSDEIVGNIMLDILLSNRSQDAYCIYNSKKALDVIQELCNKENVKVCKIHADSPLNDIKQLENKNVIGTISMSSSINLFNRNVCVINRVQEMYNIIQSINRNRSKEVVNVFVNSLMDMNNYWFNYNINVVNKKEYKQSKELKAYLIDTITKKEYNELNDKRTSPILREGKHYRFYKECRAVYFFIRYNKIEGHIKEVKVGNRIKFVEKDNLFGKREILLYDEEGKKIDDTFNLPYLFINEFNRFNPTTKTHYVKQGENLTDICNYINKLIDYVRNKELIQIWEDKDTYMSFGLGKRKGEKWNKPYSRNQLEKWKLEQKKNGREARIKNTQRYINEIMRIAV